MTAFFALIRKDLQLYLQDRRALLMHLILPAVMAAFFGFLFGGSGQQEKSKIAIAVVQQDQHPIAKRIADGLAADTNLNVTMLSAEAAREQVLKGKQKVAVVIPAGFGEAAGAALFSAAKKPELPMLYDPSESMLLAMVKGLLTQQVMQAVSAEMFNGQSGQQFIDKSMADIDKANNPQLASLRNLLGEVKRFQQAPQTAGDNTAKAGLSMPFTTRDEAVQSKTAQSGYNGYAHSFAGMSVQFILFMGLDLGIGILLVRRAGIWNRLLAAPVTLNTILLSRMVSGALIAAGLLAASFTIARIVFHVTITNLPGFALIGLAFALFTASFGLVIAAFGKTPEAARGLSVFATLLMVMLSGAWVPSFIFPAWMQNLTVVIPVRWAVDGFDAMTWRGLGMEAAWPAVAVQLGFTVVLTVLALWKFRRDAQ